ncbi:MAG: EamA/RhaT family transporter, partial [Cyanobacteria bacterium J06560_2]
MSPSPKQTSRVLLGIVLVFLSAIFLAVQNVISRLFFVPSSLFGYVSLGGWLSPQLSNIVMLLALRMALMAVLLASATTLLYPHTFTALYQLTKAPKRLACVAGSGLCLSVGLTSLYFSLSQVAAGVAIAAFFIYPAITLLLAWRFLQQSPRVYQLGLMLIIFLGVALTTLGKPVSETTVNSAVATLPSSSTLGILSGLLAGLSFGLYGIFAEIVLQSTDSRPSLHPVPFSLITFVIVSAIGGFGLF